MPSLLIPFYKLNKRENRLLGRLLLFLVVSLCLVINPGSLPSWAIEPSPSLRGSGQPAIQVMAGLVEQHTFFSKARNKETSYYAFLPAKLDSGSRYPVLYLLHGAYDDYTAWPRHADLELRRLSEQYHLIIITPDGDHFGWYADSPFDPQNQIETFFLTELLPEVEKKFPANGRRGLAGLSMGGHGAMILTLRHTATFSSVSSMSGILDITRHPGNWQLPRVFGPYRGENTRIWQEHSAQYLAQSRPERLQGLPVLVTVSTGDTYALAENRAFHQLLEKMGINHQYRESPGRHDWAYWLAELPRHVEFHAKILNSR